MTRKDTSLHFSCCHCGKQVPEGNAKYLPPNFGLICQDCSLQFHKLKRKAPQE